MLTRVKLVIGYVAHGTPTHSKPIAKAVPRMAKKHRFHADRTELQGFLAQVPVNEPRAEFAHRHGKVHAVHLRANRALYGEVALIRAIDLDLVSTHIQWREEW